MLAAALAAFVAGVFLLQQQAVLPPAPVLLALGLAAALGSAALFAGRRGASASVGGFAAAVLLAASCAAGFAYAGWRAQARLAVALAPADEGRDLRIVGVVAGLPAALDRGQRFEFLVESGDAPALPPRLSLAWYAPEAAVAPGERWSFTVRLRRPHGTLNPGGFDLEAWLFERNLRAGGYVRERPAPQRLAARVWSVGSVVDRARAGLRARLQAQVGAQRFGGVLVALVLGDQRAIAETDWLLFNRSGISHLVSISGLHITMISGLVALLAAGLWRRSARTLAWAPAQTAAAIAAVVAALAYCLLAGWGVPAQRTFFMLATVALAAWLRLGARPAATLALAAAAVNLLDPWAVIAPGFWLSFGAVAAILLTVSGVVRSRGSDSGWRARLAELGRVQLAVTAALVPLTVALFQQVAVVSIVANAVAIPLVSLLVTPLALIAGVLVLLPEPLSSLAVPCLAFAHALVEALHAFLALLTRPAWTALSLPAPPGWTVVLALAGVAWLLAPAGWPLRWAGSLWLLPMLLWPAARPDADALWVTALDVGQGTAVLVEARDHTLLYDTGPRFTSAADAGARIVLPYLRWRGIEAIDLLVVSHLDSDHSGGAASVLRGARVAAVLSSIDPAHPALAGAGAVQRCAAGQRLTLGALRIDVLRPLEADYRQPRLPSNAASCVLRVSLGAHRLLLTGDLPAREEAELAAREPDLAVDWLSVPHHGSRSSSSETLLTAARPRWASVQAGYRNRFGHPDADVLARYMARDVHVVRSDDSGATQWRFGGDGKVEVHRWRAQAHRYWHNRPGSGAPREVESPGERPQADPHAPLAEPTVPY